uniref:cysteine dioxygenase n=1 Tax=Oryza rufipogon TaxID=4529 RepID=A0A2I4S629_ORYRU|nr:hypothetical protein YJ_23 [Oryza rufipogon]
MTSPPACLRRRRLVSSPIRLVGHATVHGRQVAADWCPRLYGWLVTPPFMGVHIFTDRLAFAAADWCFRLHDWPIMKPLLGVYDFTAGLPPSPPTGVLAYTLPLGGFLALGGSLDGPSNARIQIQICIIGIHGFQSLSPRLQEWISQNITDRLAFVAADWCLRLQGWPIMPPLLGVYVFTDRLASSAADWCLCLHGWPIMPPLLGIYVFTDRLASAAADWCFRLHGKPIMPPLLGVYVFTNRPPCPPSTGVSACTAGLLCHRCWASTSSPPACLRRRRLVSPPARLAYYAAVVGRLRLHHWLASAAADWCLRLHGCPIMPLLLGVYVFTDRLASAAANWCLRLHGWPIMPPLLGVYVFTDRLASAAADWCLRLHG